MSQSNNDESIRRLLRNTLVGAYGDMDGLGSMVWPRLDSITDRLRSGLRHGERIGIVGVLPHDREMKQAFNAFMRYDVVYVTPLGGFEPTPQSVEGFFSTIDIESEEMRYLPIYTNHVPEPNGSEPEPEEPKPGFRAKAGRRQKKPFYRRFERK